MSSTLSSSFEHTAPPLVLPFPLSPRMPFLVNLRTLQRDFHHIVLIHRVRGPMFGFLVEVVLK